MMDHSSLDESEASTQVKHRTDGTHTRPKSVSDAPGTSIELVNKRKIGRQRWGSHAEFMLATVGFVIGIGNVWRFPYLCYTNGGGSFLIPYTFALLALALPMFTLEMIIGQTMQKGTYQALNSIHPRIRGVGIGACFVVMFVAIYYNVLIGWILYYMFESMWPTLPWSRIVDMTTNTTIVRAQSFWNVDVLDMSPEPFQFGHIVFPLFVLLLTVWVISYLALRRGLVVTGKLLYFAAIFPIVILFLFLFISLSLEGAAEGVFFYIKPDWGKLAGIKAWHIAAQQVFYSFGPGVGIVISLSSFNDQGYNAVRDSIFVGLVNSLASVIAGFVVFGILGHLAHIRSVPISDVVQADQGLIFVAIPEALAGLDSVSPGMRSLFSLLFFAMLFFLGMDSQFANLEAIIALFKDMGCTWSHKKIVKFVCVVGFIAGVPLVSQGGIYWFDLIDSHAAMIALFIVVLAELLSVRFLYGFDRLINEYEEQSKHRLTPLIPFLWNWVCPIYAGFLLLLTLMSAVRGDEEQIYVRTPGAYWFGMFVAIVPLVPMVLCAFFDDLTFKSQRGHVFHLIANLLNRARNVLFVRQNIDGVIQHVDADALSSPGTPPIRDPNFGLGPIQSFELDKLLNGEDYM